MANIFFSFPSYYTVCEFQETALNRGAVLRSPTRRSQDSSNECPQSHSCWAARGKCDPSTDMDHYSLPSCDASKYTSSNFRGTRIQPNQTDIKVQAPLLTSFPISTRAPAVMADLIIPRYFSVSILTVQLVRTLSNNWIPRRPSPISLQPIFSKEPRLQSYNYLSTLMYWKLLCQLSPKQASWQEKWASFDH